MRGTVLKEGNSIEGRRGGKRQEASDGDGVKDSKLDCYCVMRGQCKGVHLLYKDG